jgi:hypothetical protein
VKNFIQFDPSRGFPVGDDINYICGMCGESLPSLPVNAVACKCRNIVVDADAGRVSVKDESKIRAYHSSKA